MKNAAACAIVAAAACVHVPQIQAQTLPQELRPGLPAASLSGQARFTYWGFEVYQATLWVAPEFAGPAYEKSPFALELAYLRDFKGADIARRSIAEMRRQAPVTPMSPAQEAAWETRMRALFPDVGAGDRITGVHQPATGAVFWHNGRLLGEVRDPLFAKLFFGIWLSPQTSEPQMRRALLAREKSPTPAGAAP
ncbi:chalcone isomerase family protein [Polaromonas sp. LjRoot131]|uniref:chalcone isomerase family protein n=1 Tax=Polaromonas sp. LjRoot131 TaxID=3342262 RepID=UPI003ECE6BA2